MYILRTTTREEIRIDHDELDLIKNAKPDQLIFFRQGAIVRKLIGTITRDPDAERLVTRIPGESKSELEKRVMANRSEDIFETARTPQVPTNRRLS